MESIILKKIPTREWDQLVVCYTEDFGKQTYVAKSLSRPSSKQASHLDILNLVDFELVSKKPLALRSLGEGGIITSAYCLESYPRLKQSLPALAISSYLLEVFDKFVFDNQTDVELWQFLNNKLTQFDNLAQLSTSRVDNWGEVLKTTQREVLQVLGFEQNIDLEGVVGQRFDSLSFARQVLRG